MYLQTSNTTPLLKKDALNSHTVYFKNSWIFFACDIFSHISTKSASYVSAIFFSFTGRPGNGVGMKIVGGKCIPGTNEVGAYVATIFKGGVADQLHGEVNEGKS